MIRLSLSSLGQAAICPGSAVLDRTDGVQGRPGSALHEYAALLLGHGREAADAELDAIVDRWGLIDSDASIVRWRAQYFEPDIPAGAIVETPLCLMADGSVVAVEGARGRYDMPEGGLVPGTIDVAWTEPRPLAIDEQTRSWWRVSDGHLWVVDLKTGSEAHVPAVDRNMQVKGAALLAARYFGLPSKGVVGALCFLPRSRRDRRDGDWRIAVEPWDAEALSGIETEIRGVVARVKRSEAALAAGHMPSLVEGPHCEHCQARAACPAYGAAMTPIIRSLVQAPAAAAMAAESRQQALAIAYPMLRRGVDRLGDHLRAVVEASGPIPLPDGRVLGFERAGQTERFATRALYQALVEELALILQTKARWVVETGGDEEAFDGPAPMLAARPELSRHAEAVALLGPGDRYAFDSVGVVVRREDLSEEAARRADDAFRPVWTEIEGVIRQAMADVGEDDGLGRHMGAIKARARDAGGSSLEPTTKFRAHHPKETRR